MSEPPPPPGGDLPPPPPTGPPQGWQQPSAWRAPGAWPEPSGYAPMPSQSTNGFAVASLVLGIVGLVCGIGWILALVFGFISKRQIDQSGGRQGGRGMAIAGIVLGFVWGGLIVVYVVVVIILAATGNLDDDDDLNNDFGLATTLARSVVMAVRGVSAFV